MVEMKVRHAHLVGAARNGESRSGLATEVLSKNESLSSAVIRLSAGTEIANHRSTGECILYVVSGRGKCRTPAETIELHASSYVYLPPNTEHSLVATEDLTLLICLSHLIDPLSYFTIRARSHDEDHAALGMEAG